MGFTTTPLTPTKLQDATKDYPQSRRKAKGLRVFRGTHDQNRPDRVHAPSTARFETDLRSLRHEKIAKMLRKHEQLLLNWFESQGLSSGVVEGFNNKAKLTMRKAYGFKDSETITTALYHQLGNLPEPKRNCKIIFRNCVGQWAGFYCTLDIQSVFLKCGNLCAYMETQAFIAVYIHYTVSILYSMSPFVAARTLSD